MLVSDEELLDDELLPNTLLSKDEMPVEPRAEPDIDIAQSPDEAGKSGPFATFLAKGVPELERCLTGY